MSRTIITNSFSLVVTVIGTSQFGNRPPWVTADAVTKRFMAPLQSLYCVDTVVVICCDVTVLFTICLSLERAGSPLISWTACCPTGHEVEWPLGVTREACNLLDGTRLKHVISKKTHWLQFCILEVKLKKLLIHEQKHPANHRLCSVCFWVIWSHAYDSVQNKTR